MWYLILYGAVIPCFIATVIYVVYRAHIARKNTVEELRELNKNIKTLIALQRK